MKKIYRVLLYAGAAIYTAGKANAQVTIDGPTCVVTGMVYTYRITGVYSAQSTMQVCVTGGNLAAKDSSVQLSNCSPDKGAPLGAVNVIWSKNGKTSLTATLGGIAKTLNVNVTMPLTSGLINTRSKKQIIGYDSLPAMITCSKDTGGSCSPVYVEQWQQSLDIVSWTNIKGASDQNLTVTAPLTQTLFYRRKTTETGSGTVAYSDVAVVYVIPIAQQIEDSLLALKLDSAAIGTIHTANVKPDNAPLSLRATDEYAFIYANKNNIVG